MNALQKNIVFDARWMTPVPSGISVYSLELLRRMPALAPEWRWHVVFGSERQRDTVMEACGFPSSLKVSAAVFPHGPLSPRSQLSLPRLLKSLRCDLFHSPNYMVPFLAFGSPKSLLGLAKPSRRGCGACVATIHDAIPLILRDYAPRSVTSRMRWLYRESMRLAVRCSARTITGSEASRRDIAVALRLGEREAASFRTIYDGVSDRFSPAPPGKTKTAAPSGAKPAKIVLYVGRLDPYKNVPMLVDAFAMVLKDSGIAAHLLVVGPEDPRYPEARLHAQYRGISESVSFIHGASDAELLAAYRSADVLVNPSRYEGFGLPMVEAMKCGVPVVCTDGGSQPEIAGGAAEIVPAGDEASLAGAIRRVLEDGALRADLSARGLERSKRFSWDATAAETVALYREVLDGAADSPRTSAQGTGGGK